MIRRSFLSIAFAFYLILLALPSYAQEAVDQDLVKSVTDLYTMNEGARADAIERLAARNKPDIAAPLIELLPLFPQNAQRIGEILRRVTGADVPAEWFPWMLWQEEHPEIRPFAGYDVAKARFLGQIDLEFLRFVFPGVKSDIRLEEIAWGGTKFDEIPALSHPVVTTAQEAAWLADDDLVFGVSINGEHRAYPRRILHWHEIVNDTIGNVPVVLTFCVVCYSAILYEARPQGRVLPFEFGTSGLLHRGNKLMYDRQSESLWSQMTGKPVIGDLVGTGMELKQRPLVTARWKDWRQAHPDTKVLSLETGHNRDYLKGDPYGDYLASPAMMFPAAMKDWSRQPKTKVFGLRLDGAARSWALSDFAGGKVINDSLGGTPIVLVGEEAGETLRVYRRGENQFKPGAKPDELLADGKVWKLSEDALLGPAGEKLERLPSQTAFWFAWQGRFPATK